MSETRIPTQKRSIEKRNRIIEKGFELMCEKGFYNTNTNEIADYARVSTGIIYQYFNDKKDIFIEGTKIYVDKILYPMVNILETKKVNKDNFKDVISNMIDKLLKTHNISKNAHQELMAMEHLDDDIANIFKENELKVTDKIVSILSNNGFNSENQKEKVHIIYKLIDDYCHEVIYHQHSEINYAIMKEEVLNIVINTLK